jgi:hypothetical protein
MGETIPLSVLRNERPIVIIPCVKPKVTKKAKGTLVLDLVVTTTATLAAEPRLATG